MNEQERERAYVLDHESLVELETWCPGCQQAGRSMVNVPLTASIRVCRVHEVRLFDDGQPGGSWLPTGQTGGHEARAMCDLLHRGVGLGG